MAIPLKYQTKEVLNKVLNTAETALQVDIVSGSEYAEDSAHTDADTCNFILGVRNDTLAALGGTDGDYVPFQMNSSGALFVEASVESGKIKSGAIASGAVASGAVASGAVASGAIASGAVASGAIASGAVASGALASGSVADGAMVTLGAKADAKSTATDTTAITAMQVLKQISASVQETATDTGTIDSDTNDIKTAVEIIDNAISGSEMQVDVVGSLPAGSAAIGKLAANSGVDIGDVDVTSVVPGYAATSLGKREDDAHSSLDTGVMVLAVRNDALESLSGTDGDYSALQVNKTGALNVTETTGHLGAIFEDGTENITSKQVIAIQFIEDTTFTTLTPVDSSYIGTASSNGDAIDTDNTFPQGMTIFGRWTGYRLASGSIVAYQGSW